MNGEPSGDGTIAVRFFADLRQVFGMKQAQLPREAAPDVRHLLEVVCDTPERRAALFAEPGVLRKEIVFLVNGRNIRFLDGVDTRLERDDVVAVFPPVYGG